MVKLFFSDILHSNNPKKTFGRKQYIWEIHFTNSSESTVNKLQSYIPFKVFSSKGFFEPFQTIFTDLTSIQVEFLLKEMKFPPGTIVSYAECNEVRIPDN